MHHKIFGRKLSRTKNERRRLFQVLARELIKHDGIVITLAKAKALQPLIERLVTNAKKGNQSGAMVVRKVLADRISSNKLLNEAQNRFSSRNSGFTRIIHLGLRKSDATEMSRLEFVDDQIVSVKHQLKLKQIEKPQKEIKIKTRNNKKIQPKVKKIINKK